MGSDVGSLEGICVDLVVGRLVGLVIVIEGLLVGTTVNIVLGTSLCENDGITVGAADG